MVKAHRWPIACAVVALLVGGSQAAELRALVLSGANNHDWQTTTPEIVRQLEATGLFEVDVTNDPGSLSAAEIRRYDVLVNNYYGPEWSEPTRQAALDYLADGGGMVVIHAADNAFPGWVEFESLIGVAWRGGAGHGTYHRYMVTIDDPQHPILKGVPHFLHAPDELYHNLTWGEGSKAVVIASAYSRPEESGTGRVEPMLLVNHWGKGRMFHTVMGHDVPTLQGFYHTLILQRGAEWAATGRVTQALPADMPQESWIDPEADAPSQVEQWVGLGVPEGLARRVANAASGGDRARALIEVLRADAPAAQTVARQKLIWLGAEAVDAMVEAAGGDLTEVMQTDLTTMANRSRRVVSALTSHAHGERSDLALSALAAAGEPGAVDVFASLLDDTGAAGLALDALARTPGREATEALMRATYRADDEQLVRLLRALGERADGRAAPVLVRHSRDRRDAVRHAALQALGGLPTASSEVALRAAYSAEPTAAAGLPLMSIAQAYGREGQARRALDLVRLVLSQGVWEGRQVAALGALAAVDDVGAFELASGYVADGAPAVAVAAIDAVAAQSYSEADGTLIGLLSSPDEDIRNRAALHLAIRASDEGAAALGAVARDPLGSDAGRIAAAQSLAGMATRAAAEALLASLDTEPEAVRSAVVGAAEKAATRLAQGPHSDFARTIAGQLLAADATAVRAGLRILASKADPSDEGVIRQHLAAADQDTARTAIVAAVALARSLREAAEEQRATDLLVAALEALPAEAANLGVTAELEALGAGSGLARQQGFLTSFHLIGPFPNPEGAGFSAVYPPEEGVDLGAPIAFEGADLTWTPFEIGNPSGVADLAPVVSSSQDVVVYAYTEFSVNAAMDAVLKLGSDDGIVAWLNGERIHGADAARPVQVDQDVVDVRLKQGTNTLLLKITQGGGNFGFVARLVDTEGRPVIRP